MVSKWYCVNKKQRKKEDNSIIHEKYLFFRKFELYPLSFQDEVSNNNVLVAAPYGGSIAVTRNSKKLVKVQGANKPTIYLYTSSGKLTAKLQVKVSKAIFYFKFIFFTISCL